MTTKANFKNLPEDVKEALNEADTAFVVLNVGRDHGITPQAASSCREAWKKIRKAMGIDSEEVDTMLDGSFRDCHCD